MLGQASIPKSIGSCISYNGKTTINLSRTIKENNIEKTFYNILKELGINPSVKTNIGGNDYE